MEAASCKPCCRSLFHYSYVMKLPPLISARLVHLSRAIVDARRGTGLPSTVKSYRLKPNQDDLLPGKGVAGCSTPCALRAAQAKSRRQSCPRGFILWNVATECPSSKSDLRRDMFQDRRASVSSHMRCGQFVDHRRFNSSD